MNSDKDEIEEVVKQCFVVEVYFWLMILTWNLILVWLCRLTPLNCPTRYSGPVCSRVIYDSITGTSEHRVYICGYD